MRRHCAKRAPETQAVNDICRLRFWRSFGAGSRPALPADVRRVQLCGSVSPWQIFFVSDQPRLKPLATNGSRLTRIPVAGEDRVRHRRRDWRQRDLAEAGRVLAAGDDVELDLRRVAVPEQRIVLERALHRAAARDRDLAEHRRAEAVDDAALRLGLEVQRIHREADVDRGDDAVNADALPGVDRHLGDFRAHTIRTCSARRCRGRALRAADCPIPTSRPRAAARASAVRAGTAPGCRPRTGSSPVSPRYDSRSATGSTLARVRQFVEDALDHERVEVVRRRAQRAGRHRGAGLRCIPAGNAGSASAGDRCRTAFSDRRTAAR